MQYYTHGRRHSARFGLQLAASEGLKFDHDPGSRFSIRGKTLSVASDTLQNLVLDFGPTLLGTTKAGGWITRRQRGGDGRDDGYRKRVTPNFSSFSSFEFLFHLRLPISCSFSHRCH